ncbi:MAG: hypothetical protein AUG13_01815 [Chloroflexi bacterium 13_1_20CM_2_59_7]|nr:MAG: hypothetical protein AUG13_01815 [Chloroflexi bacterium 13_1_20CM_2_59_7]
MSDGNRVVLQANPTVVIQQRYASRIAGSVIISLLGERHVVFAEFTDGGVRVHLRQIVPEAELACARDQVGTEDAPVIIQTARKRHIELGLNLVFRTITRATGVIRLIPRPRS